MPFPAVLLWAVESSGPSPRNPVRHLPHHQQNKRHRQGADSGAAPLSRYQEIEPFEPEDSRLFWLPNIIEGWGHCGINSAHRTPSGATRKIRKSITLRCFYDFPKRGNFLITRRSGVRPTCGRLHRERSSLANPSPATKNEAPGVVRISGAFVLSGPRHNVACL